MLFVLRYLKPSFISQIQFLIPVISNPLPKGNLFEHHISWRYIELPGMQNSPTIGSPKLRRQNGLFALSWVPE